ncbi:unnamed protein product [Paramecium pentaurelia]|uniref:Casein kinase I n=1 Tax=Paramecium pentaurelia TaxID=43138 RepID=A0A8S1WXV7_9CILI|nr:unnamed protein product [Paramecium pentaurelia]
MSDIQQGQIVANLYKVLKLLSQGSFGKVYLGKNLKTGESVAIKVEKQQMQRFFSLNREIDILNKLQGIQGVPELIWFGEQNGLQIMITNMLGFDLMYFLKKHKKFSIDCVFNIAYQMLEILEKIHKLNIIHRDLKPENILGKVNSNQIHLIDFGIAKDLTKKSKFTYQKIPFIGTSRYASISAHFGEEQNRKDDLEALGYVLIYLIKQELPWMRCEKQQDNRLIKIGQMKKNLSLEKVCEGCPQQILNYMKQIQTLTTKQLPNYRKLKGIFENSPLYIKWVIFDWYECRYRNYKSKQELKVNQQKKKKYDSAQQIQLSIEKTPSKASRINRSTTMYGNSNPSSQLNSMESDNKKRSIKSTESIYVDFVNSDSYILSKNNLNKAETLNQIFEADEFMPLRDQLQLMQQENQDLEMKHHLLHYRSVNFNFKNPIQRYLQFQIN